MATAPRMVRTLEEVMDPYAVVLSDVWGVVHNGVRAYGEACDALARARASGRSVVLITNAPRPHDSVEAQLDSLRVPREAYDRVVTSGDVTRDLIRSGPRQVFHLGPDRDMTIYDGLDIDLVEEFEAAAVVCTGLVDDETETPEHYEEALRRYRARDLPFICANPDIVVEKGERLLWCAGALARDYARLGGRTLISGKPHRPIYEAALAAASEVLGRAVEPGQVLAVGDGVMTDVKGAADNGLDVLYVTGGIHAAEYGEVLDPDPDRLGGFLGRHGYAPVAAMPRLA
ncbi:MAG: TIGR01459 family HAD-type hydrolase [Rhizobiaceae bacterium]|nr:TIGR01459 family HAD-type hydrolase [Rhizobiaceae bacterium]MCV0406153.1 TIGR01459 family HAD-type hydrolase [Rhizobiaceae bacterium]